jgi:hypothetical protein
MAGGAATLVEDLSEHRMLKTSEAIGEPQTTAV